MPLVLDRRLRVFATEHDVWAEALTAPDDLDPYWSLRRWPQVVLGVVAVGETDAGAPVVVAKWSDGLLTGIDARTGKVAWRHTVERKHHEDHYIGGPTGVYAVYGDDTLFGLYTAHTRQGRRVVISSGEYRVRAFEPVTGQQLWIADLTGCWHGTDWTMATTFVAIRACNHAEGAYFYDAGTGQPVATWRPDGDTPDARDWGYELYGCQTAASGCAGFAPYRHEAHRIDQRGDVVADQFVDDGTLAGTSVIKGESPRNVVALARSTGRERWRRSFEEPVWVEATDQTAVYLRTAGDDLLKLDAGTGDTRARVKLPRRQKCFHAYATDGFVVIDCSGFDYTDRHAQWDLPQGAPPVLLLGT